MLKKFFVSIFFCLGLMINAYSYCEQCDPNLLYPYKDCGTCLLNSCEYCQAHLIGCGYFPSSYLPSCPHCGEVFNEFEIPEDLLTKTGCNNFATNIYSQIKRENTNIFFSPYSIHSALSMAFAGANGNTEREMANTLQIHLAKNEFHPAYSKLNLARLLKNKIIQNSCNLNIANKLFIQDGFEIEQNFRHTISQYYGASLEQLDFANNPQQASNTINKWVAQETQDKIQNIVSPKMFNQGTSLAIINAIYFKSDWSKPFSQKNTLIEPFLLQDNSFCDVSMMNQTETFNYTEDEYSQVIELPYKDNKFSMIVVLPKNSTNLSKVETELTLIKLSSWLDNFTHKKINLRLPKFKLESTFNLKEHLIQMGMTSPFTNADFSGITIKKPLCISNVIHKAFIDVDETGSEAAASTAVIFVRSAYIPYEPVIFNANHPFVFLIKENTTNTILFMGKVNKPIYNK